MAHAVTLVYFADSHGTGTIDDTAPSGINDIAVVPSYRAISAPLAVTPEVRPFPINNTVNPIETPIYSFAENPTIQEVAARDSPRCPRKSNSFNAAVYMSIDTTVPVAAEASVEASVEAFVEASAEAFVEASVGASVEASAETSTQASAEAARVRETASTKTLDSFHASFKAYAVLQRTAKVWEAETEGN